MDCSEIWQRRTKEYKGCYLNSRFRFLMILWIFKEECRSFRKTEILQRSDTNVIEDSDIAGKF